MHKDSKPFSIRRRLLSFRYAWAGLKLMVRTEHNAWIHCTAAAAVVAAGVLLGISALEWVAVVLCIGMVFAAEAVNSALERICDMVQPGPDDRVRDIKDLAAGAVLACAVAAAVAGAVIFLPKVAALFG